MRHCGTQEIQTERLLLRRLEVSDTEMMFGNWASDPEVTKYLRWEAHHSWAQSAEFINDTVKHYAEDDFYLWGITQKSTGILVGCIHISRTREQDGAWTFDAGPLGEAWEPGLCLGRKWWGQGYATEALIAVRDYWFKNTGAHWLRCCHAPENAASEAVIKKAGFIYDHDSTYEKEDGTAVPCRVYLYVRKHETRKPRPAPVPDDGAGQPLDGQPDDAGDDDSFSIQL
ncbi:MAG: GNAT family N-acetyltransferase [Gemmiger sp.]